MSITKNDLIPSNRELKIGEKVVLLGNNVVMPVDNTELNFSFSQLVGYDQNDKPIMQELNFHGSEPFLTQKQVNSNIVDIKSVIISMNILNANTNVPTEALGIYTITNTVSTNWNNYIWKNANDFQIIKINNNWVVQKDNVTYATNTTNSPLNNSWDNITEIVQVRFNNYQNISFFRCINVINNYQQWTGEQCRFNPNTNQFISNNRNILFDVTNNLIPLENCYYVVLNYKTIITQCNNYYYQPPEYQYTVSSSNSSNSESSL